MTQEYDAGVEKIGRLGSVYWAAFKTTVLRSSPAMMR
jgi:hypothetical protein